MILQGNLMILLWDNGDLIIGTTVILPGKMMILLGKMMILLGKIVILLGKMVILLWENDDVTIFMAVMAPT